MKIRKHKSNRTFRIDFQTRPFPVVKNKANVGGWEQRGAVLSQPQQILTVGISAGAVLNGFLFGRDRGNTLINRVVCLA